jgi:K+-sensing histidine kinase KdpD
MKNRSSSAELVAQRGNHPVPYEMAMVGAALGPLVACGLLSQLLPALVNTSAALILVLAIVAAARTGYRSAGVIAAISAGVWFDFFLTAPYLTFSVESAADVETLIVLVLLGIVTNEIIHWGRRYQFQLRDRDAYLYALLVISDADGRTVNACSMPSAGTS